MDCNRRSSVSLSFSLSLYVYPFPLPFVFDALYFSASTLVIDSSSSNALSSSVLQVLYVRRARVVPCCTVTGMCECLFYYIESGFQGESKVSFGVLSNTPWIAPLVHQGAKVEPPGLPNDRFGHQEVTTSV